MKIVLEPKPAWVGAPWGYPSLSELPAPFPLSLCPPPPSSFAPGPFLLCPPPVRLSPTPITLPPAFLSPYRSHIPRRGGRP